MLFFSCYLCLSVCCFLYRFTPSIYSKRSEKGTQPMQRRIDTSCHTIQQYVMFYFTDFYGFWDFSVLPIFRRVCPMLSFIMYWFKFYDFSHNSLVGISYAFLLCLSLASLRVCLFSSLVLFTRTALPLLLLLLLSLLLLLLLFLFILWIHFITDRRTRACLTANLILNGRTATLLALNEMFAMI